MKVRILVRLARMSQGHTLLRLHIYPSDELTPCVKVVAEESFVARWHPILGQVIIQSSGENTPEKSQQVLRCKDRMAKAALCLIFVLRSRTGGTIVF